MNENYDRGAFGADENKSAGAYFLLLLQDVRKGIATRYNLKERIFLLKNNYRHGHGTRQYRARTPELAPHR